MRNDVTPNSEGDLGEIVRIRGDEDGKFVRVRSPQKNRARGEECEEQKDGCSQSGAAIGAEEVRGGEPD